MIFKRKSHVKTRLTLICIVIFPICIGIALLLHFMSDSIIFFYPPSKLPRTTLQKEVRVGGLVKLGSITKLSTDIIQFTIEDSDESLIVQYQGIIPTLFREKQTIVAKGMLQNNVFIAKELLAKHDENYMPHEAFTKSSSQTYSNPQ